MFTGKRYVDSVETLSDIAANTPPAGSQCWVNDLKDTYIYDGTNWVSMTWGGLATTYNASTTENIVIPDENWVGFMSIKNPNEQPAGQYKYGINMIWTFDSAVESVYFRYTIGENPDDWVEFATTPSASSAQRATSFSGSKEYPAGELPILKVQARKETGGSPVLTIVKGQVLIQRMK
jgi:hypothetical protein